MKKCYVMFRFEGQYRIEQYYRPKKRRDIYKDLKRGFINIPYGHRKVEIPLEDIVGYRENKEDFHDDFPQLFI